ncbi:DUF1501 domain-containing protein [Horticoccus sp. 23ND18S-11]|uniref:DUF1501 domain-containing protein n=1 Tax=Horticoccus sp. 23ND18S-11 TaxID=3391832 RepID=UPI0039C90E34
MNPKNPNFDPNRRKFLGACCAAVSATGMLSTLAQLRMMGAVASPDNGPVTPARAGALPPDYKALVCLFLAGGNDANNMIVPFDTAGYNAYASAAGRGAIALPRGQLLGITPKTSDGREWALHSSLNADVAGTNSTGLKSIFDAGQMALIGNVGTLVVPTTKQQYSARSVPLPPQLFSHNDQQVEWQSSVPDKPFSTGWGGRVADLVDAMNSSSSVSMSISLNGQNSFQVGKRVVQFAVNPGGAISLTGASTSATNAAGMRTRAQNDLLAAPNANLFDAAFAGLTSNAISDSAMLSGILSGNPPFTTTFSNSGLGQQLRTIARLIAAAPQLGLKRQVFFARVGGWDLHDAQLGAHANLFADVSRNVAALYRTTVELGCAEQVTTFTASDFGRTYNTNGDGSDHGWGSNHLVVGGAVKGGDLYGRMADLTIRGPDDTGTRGSWIPTTSVDEYAATLAAWFGVSATNLPVVFPNLGRFAKPNLGFI